MWASGSACASSLNHIHPFLYGPPMKIGRITIALAALGLMLLTTAQTYATDDPTTVQTVKLTIDGMCCASCLPDIEKSLSAVAGVQTAKATYKPPQAVVTYDTAKATIKALIKAIGKVGYVAKVKAGGQETH